MPWKNIKLVPRSDDEPKYNPKNKTDRKIVSLVIGSIVVLALIAVGLFVIYYTLIKK